MVSCARGNFGETDELTGSLTDFGLAGFGTASLDGKVNQGVAAN